MLGGTGNIGRWVVRDLFDFSDADIVVAAPERKAEKLVRSFRSARVTSASVDVRNVSATARVLRNSDVVVNCVIYYFNLQVMRACLKAGAHYLDVGGLFHMTRKQLKLHAQFKKKGLLAVLGCGATPGITNILAAHGVQFFDNIDEIHISFGDKDYTRYHQPFVLPYSLHTLFDECTMKPAVFSHGTLRMVKPLSGSEFINFPAPVGQQKAFYTLHSEVATLPSSFQLKECSFRAAFDDVFIHQIRFLIDAGFASPEKISVDGMKVAPKNVTAAVMGKWLPEPGTKIRDVELLRVKLCGKKSGRKLHKVLYCATRSNKKHNIPAGTYDTAVPASVVAQMIAHGRIHATGVLPPERCVPPELFFRELRKRKIRVLVGKV